MKNVLSLVTFLVSILVFVACSAGVRPTAMPTATYTPPPTPPFTLTPTPTTIPTPIPTPTLTPVPGPGPQEVTDAYLAAFNAGDVEAIGDIYTDDVVFSLGNEPFGLGGQPITNSYTGKVAVIGNNLQSIADNAKITLSNTSVVGNKVSSRFSYIADSSDFGDIWPLTGTWETVVEGGKITSLTMTLDNGTYEKLKAAVLLASPPLPPIVVAEGTARQDVNHQLPGSEVECIRQNLGEEAFGQFSQTDFSDETSEAENEALSRCLSNESISRFFIGFAVSLSGRLSDATIGCMGSELSPLDLQATFFSEDAWGEAFQAMTGCFSDEERARAEADGFFGGVGGEEWPTGSPGLVDVGGRQIYLTCEGEGSPTVVMEAGGRGNSGSWYLVQPFVADFTRVCAYDRAGTGYSDSVPVNDTAQEIADELHSLLASAGVDGPYILAGHSLGGNLVLTFANRYLNEVVGMVLVDTGHGDPVARFQEALTPEEWQLVRDVILHADEGFTLPGGLDLLGPDLGDIPLVVLTAGRRGASPVPPDIAQRLNQVQQDAQGELLTLSSNSTHVIAEESGHGIPMEQPDLVIKAIRQVVEAVRSHETPAPPVSRRIPPPQLHVVGNQKQNINGEQVVLRGVAIADPFFLANYRRDKHFIREDYRVLAQEWGANIIKVLVLPRMWEG